MRIGRVINFADAIACSDIRESMIGEAQKMLDEILVYQQRDDRYHDILDDESSFMYGSSALMLAAFIYREIVGGWLDSKYRDRAKLVAETMEQYVDRYGIIHEVCGRPDFIKQGTSVEAMAAYIMMPAWIDK